MMSCVKTLVLIFSLSFTNLASKAQLQLQPVQVTWVDIVASDGGWRSLEQGLQWSTDTVTQIGYLLRQDQHTIVLTDSYFINRTDSSEQVIGYVVAIPLATVVQIKPL